MADPAHTRPLLLPRVLPRDGRRIVSGSRYGSYPDVTGRISAFDLACRCIADNENVPSLRAEGRAMLGIVLVGPTLGCLGMVALLLGIAPF